MNYQVKSDGPVSSCGGWRRWHCIDLTNQLEESVLDHCTVVKFSKEHGSVGVSSLILAHIGSQALTIDNNLN